MNTGWLLWTYDESHEHMMTVMNTYKIRTSHTKSVISSHHMFSKINEDELHYCSNITEPKEKNDYYFWDEINEQRILKYSPEKHDDQNDEQNENDCNTDRGNNPYEFHASRSRSRSRSGSHWFEICQRVCHERLRVRTRREFLQRNRTQSNHSEWRISVNIMLKLTA